MEQCDFMVWLYGWSGLHWQLSGIYRLNPCPVSVQTFAADRTRQPSSASWRPQCRAALMPQRINHVKVETKLIRGLIFCYNSYIDAESMSQSSSSRLEVEDSRRIETAFFNNMAGRKMHEDRVTRRSIVCFGLRQPTAPLSNKGQDQYNSKPKQREP
jgi:hypothetical protein